MSNEIPGVEDNIVNVPESYEGVESGYTEPSIDSEEPAEKNDTGLKRSVSDIIKSARERNVSRKNISGGKKESPFSRMKRAFFDADKEASVDADGNTSKFKKFVAGASVAGGVLKRGATAVKDGVIDFGNGIKGFAINAHDSFSSRHAKTKWAQISKQFSDEEILDAAKKINSDTVLQDALDTVHNAGYITAGGDEYLRDLSEAKRLNDKGYEVKIAPTVANVYIPESYGGKFDAKMQVSEFDGLAAKDPVSSIANDIRAKLGDSAQRGKDALIDESIDAVANIAHSLDRLKAIADRDDLPESVKTFFSGEQWQAIQQMLDGKNSEVETRMGTVIGKSAVVQNEQSVQPDTPVSEPAVAEVENEEKLDLGDFL